MRRLLLSLALAGGLAAAGAAPATAEAPPVVELPDAACNEGTMTAHGSIPDGVAGHPHVPHDMNGCMTMPAAGH